jgi:DNA-binding MarR family transcriptional regulator
MALNPLPPDEIEDISVFLKSLEPFFKLNANIPLRCVQALFLVAQREGRSVSDYAQLAEMPASTMSRNLLDIGERNRHMEPGFGLVVGKRNPENLRELEYFLSVKGRALVRKVIRRFA